MYHFYDQVAFHLPVWFRKWRQAGKRRKDKKERDAGAGRQRSTRRGRNRAGTGRTEEKSRRETRRTKDGRTDEEAGGENEKAKARRYLVI